MLAKLKSWARSLKRQIVGLYFASKSKQVAWPVKLFLILIVGYALSPIDLIPDFIPVLGYLDDVILLPLGIWLAIKMIPHAVWMACLEKAEAQEKLPSNKTAATLIVILWLLLALLLFKYFAD